MIPVSEDIRKSKSGNFHTAKICQGSGVSSVKIHSSHLKSLVHFIVISQLSGWIDFNLHLSIGEFVHFFCKERSRVQKNMSFRIHIPISEHHLCAISRCRGFSWGFRCFVTGASGKNADGQDGT